MQDATPTRNTSVEAVLTTMDYEGSPARREAGHLSLAAARVDRSCHPSFLSLPLSGWHRIIRPKLSLRGSGLAPVCHGFPL